MLTTNYSIIALSSEQQNARRILGQLRQCLHNAVWHDAGSINLDWLENVFNKLMMIDRYCHERKIERYVIPAIRRVSTDSDVLLGQLDAMSDEAVRMLRYAYDQIQLLAEGDGVDLEMLIAAMDLYCEQMLERLTLEEQELFPVARRLLSDQEWFRLAAYCLSNARAQPYACRPPSSANVHGYGRRHGRFVH